MASKVVIFPADKQADATAYMNACNAHYAANFEPDGVFGEVKADIHGQWVTPFYGHPWDFNNGQPTPEPAECAALRDSGLVDEFADWPE